MNRQLMPQKRRRSREIALQLGYEMDVRERLSVEDVLAAFPLEEEDPEIRDYACALGGALDRHKEAIDDLLREQLVGWRPERMVAVDRAAIRLALLEGVFEKLVPLAVAISEAVELAKTFGTEDSGRFVNGVLGRIVRSLEPKAGSDAPGDSPSSGC